LREKCAFTFKKACYTINFNVTPSCERVCLRQRVAPPRGATATATATATAAAGEAIQKAAAVAAPAACGIHSDCDVLRVPVFPGCHFSNHAWIRTRNPFRFRLKRSY
jgi:hypothetical protein